MIAARTFLVQYRVATENNPRLVTLPIDVENADPTAQVNELYSRLSQKLEDRRLTLADIVIVSMKKSA